METTSDRPNPPSNSPVSWGIFGGTFNPPHWGHIHIAQAALEQASLQQVLWIPAYRPPHRTTHPILAFEQRLAMVNRAIASYPQFQASDIERTSSTKSFAIHTLEQLQATYPAVAWHWILGLDTFCTLPRWYQSDRLVPRCTWLIAPRSQPTSPPAEATTETLEHIQAQAANWAEKGIALRWQLLDMLPISISSSQIRQRARDRQSIDSLVPASVKTYILHNQVYPASNEPKVDS